MKQREAHLKRKGSDPGLLHLLRGRVPFHAAGFDADGMWFDFENALCTNYTHDNATDEFRYTLLEVVMIERKPEPCKPSTWIAVRASELREAFRARWPQAPMPKSEDFTVQALVECLDRLSIKVQP